MGGGKQLGSWLEYTPLYYPGYSPYGLKHLLGWLKKAYFAVNVIFKKKNNSSVILRASKFACSLPISLYFKTKSLFRSVKNFRFAVFRICIRIFWPWEIRSESIYFFYDSDPTFKKLKEKRRFRVFFKPNESRHFWFFR